MLINIFTVNNMNVVNNKRPKISVTIDEKSSQNKAEGQSGTINIALHLEKHTCTCQIACAIKYIGGANQYISPDQQSIPNELG